MGQVIRFGLATLTALAFAACGSSPTPAEDGGSADSGSCTGDEACDDGLFCTGIESCAPGAAGADARGCRVATAPCTSGQTCDEALDRCVTECAVAEDADGDGSTAMECGGEDCDDSDPLAHPGAVEVCDPDHRDEDCDPTTIGERDRDADGFADAVCCNPRADGVLVCGEDCNDLERSVAPDGAEICDGFDNDCDGAVDERVTVRGFRDDDGDLHGDPTMPLTACPGDGHFSSVDDDCDDADRTVHGSQAEFCNSRDDDCDGSTDENTEALTWYRDADGDGFGTAEDTVSSCTPRVGYSLLGTDCDDATPSIHPGAAEACNGRDDDCNGRADFRVGREDYEDDDHDGSPDADCAPVAEEGDCDDRDADVRPGAPELLDRVDNDCDAAIDDVCQMASWYVDADGDGFGDGASTPMRSCEAIEGRAPRDGDCDDTDADRSPAVRDVCNDTDDDCDTRVDETSDGLCFLAHATGVCQEGACEIKDCVSGFRDCDGTVASGCEISLASDALNCGGCGVECAGGDRAAPLCAGGRCDLACDDGYGDCDDLAANGCESDVLGDELNCGACNRICSNRPNAARDCRLGACEFDCAPGYEDCDGSEVNGCEAFLFRDPTSCGMCGMACTIAGEMCIAGSCDPPPFPSTSTTDLRPGGSMSLAPGVHLYDEIDIPEGVVITTAGGGALDLRATGLVRIAGTIDLSGGNGGNGLNTGGGGGATGNPLGVGGDGNVMPYTCGGAGGGGAGSAGTMAAGGGGVGACGRGGMFGGGESGDGIVAGGGGGGYAGGGGGGDYQSHVAGAGGSAAGGVGGAGGGAGTPCLTASGGQGPGAYAGTAGTCGGYLSGSGGAGGAIGADAAADLAVVSTFRPGSGGGGAGGSYAGAGTGGGGGGGGAVRIASATRIEIAFTGAVLADGGDGGGRSTGPEGPGGGGGSGGLVYLSAPALSVQGRVSAVGGLGGAPTASGRGGAGGLGRIRISTYADQCELAGATMTPPLASGCAPASVPERAYVASWPN